MNAAVPSLLAARLVAAEVASPGVRVAAVAPSAACASPALVAWPVADIGGSPEVEHGSAARAYSAEATALSVDLNLQRPP